MKVHTSVLVICLILAVVGGGATQVLHHDRLDGYDPNDHIDWTTSDANDANFATTGTGDFGYLKVSNWLQTTEMTPPTGNPPANTAWTYLEDIHGFSFFSYRDSTGMVRKLVRDSVIVVKNERGSTIAAGRIVYAIGSENTVPTVDLAKADSSSTMPAIGVTLERIEDGAYGRVMQTGLLENVNTNSFSTGDVLYVSDTTAGIPKSTVPVTPSLSQEIGTILVSDSTAGQIQIVSRSVHQNETGTAQNTFLIGDGTSDGKTLTFNAITDGSIIWDETKFDLDGAPLYTSNSGQFGGGVGIGADPIAALPLRIVTSHADSTAIRIDNTGAGDPVVQFALSGTVKYVMGIDDSDSDKFKISSGTTLGAPTLIIDSSINLSGIGTITSGAINTLHIVPGTDPTWGSYVFLSGDGTTEDGGLSIAIPYTAGKHFAYGRGGTEHHFFGAAGNTEITDDGQIITYGVITSIANTLNLGDNSSANDTVINFLSSGNDGDITYDQTDDEFDFGDAAITTGTLTVSDGSIDDTDGSIAFGDTNLTGVGTIGSSDVTITGAGTNPALRMNQGGDSKGIYIYGFDDHNDKHIDMYVNSSGFGIVNSATDWYFTYDEGLRLLIRNFYVASYVDFVVLDDLLTVFGEDRDYGLGYYNTDDELQLVDGHTINTNVRMTMDSSGNFDFKAGEILFGNKVKFTQSDGNEYIDSLADGYMDYSSTTAHRFHIDGEDNDVRLELIGTDYSGELIWDESDRNFLLNAGIIATRNDWIPPYISLRSTLSIAQSGGYTPMFESRMDTDGADVETRLESTDALGRVGTNSAHDLDLITNSAARMTISAAGYVRVINRLMVGADAAPTVALDVTGDIHASGWIRSSDADYRRYYHLSVGGFDPGASGATWIDPDGDTTGGWQLNTSAEKLIAGTDIHSDWDGVSDIMAEMRFALNDTAGGDPNVDLQLIAYYNGIEDTSTKTQTVEVITDTDGTQYKVYSVEFTLDYDATDNVIEAGDHITFILNLETDTSEIDDIIITEGTFYYNTTHTGIESGDT